MIGSEIGGCVIEKIIGVGGFAYVYLAYDEKLDRHVAIKILKQHLSAEPLVVERFHRDAKIAASLQHPNVVTIHQIGRQNGYDFIIMEYIEDTLEKRLSHTGKVDVGTGIKIVKDLCRALEYAHSKNVIHRDISASNVLLKKSGEAVLADFGIARHLTDERLTPTGEILGKFQYMSPEQFKGRKVDYLSDIYSLGVLMYRMFTGYFPFHGQTFEEYWNKHVYDEPMPPRKIDKDTPRVVERVIIKALEKDPCDRYSSAYQLICALEENIVTSRRKRVVATISIVAAAIALSIMYLLYMRPPPSPGPHGLDLDASELFSDTPSARADGDDRVVITVLARDVHGDLMNAQPVSFEITGEGNYVKRSAGVTDSRGAATCTLSSTVAESKEVRARIDNELIDKFVRIDFLTVPVKTVEPLETPVRAPSIEPTPKYGILVVNAYPYAVVYLDGKRKGDTPLTIDGILVGDHRVELKSPPELSRSFDTTVTIHENRDVRLSHAFEFGVLSIITNPIGMLHLDGVEIGYPPKVLSMVAVGRHTITVTWNDQSERSMEVPVEDRHETRVSIIHDDGKYELAPMKGVRKAGNK